jgi:hypothetical protein
MSEQDIRGGLMRLSPVAQPNCREMSLSLTNSTYATHAIVAVVVK